jgi:hypothetical protein
MNAKGGLFDAVRYPEPYYNLTSGYLVTEPSADPDFRVGTSALEKFGPFPTILGAPLDFFAFAFVFGPGGRG